MRPSDDAAPIVLFDGVCNLCSGLVAFVIRHDAAPGRFRFAALQSPAGQALLRRHGLATGDFDTFVVVDGGRAYVRSDATLRVLRGLGRAWALLGAVVGMVPRRVRDAGYGWVARHRYGWFGKKDECLVPTAEVRGRFLE